MSFFSVLSQTHRQQQLREFDRARTLYEKYLEVSLPRFQVVKANSSYLYISSTPPTHLHGSNLPSSSPNSKTSPALAPSLSSRSRNHPCPCPRSCGRRISTLRWRRVNARRPGHSMSV